MKFQEFHHMNFQDLIQNESITEKQVDHILKCVINRKNILVSGGVGSGKTTIMNALMNEIPVNLTVLALDGNGELRAKRDNIVYQQIPDDGIGKLITFYNAVTRPDYLISEELRGEGFFEIISGMKHVKEKSYFTSIYAPNPFEALFRTMYCAIEYPQTECSDEELKSWLGDSLDLIIHTERYQNGKRKMELYEVSGYSPQKGGFQLTEIL